MLYKYEKKKRGKKERTYAFRFGKFSKRDESSVVVKFKTEN